MKIIINWIVNNKEWLLSGLGCSILGLIIKIFFFNNNKTTYSQQIKSGNHCLNDQKMIFRDKR